MELIIGLVVIGLALYGLAKLTDFFEERNFPLWLFFSLAGGALSIMVLYAASQAGYLAPRREGTATVFGRDSGRRIMTSAGVRLEAAARGPCSSRRRPVVNVLSGRLPAAQASNRMAVKCGVTVRCGSPQAVAVSGRSAVARVTRAGVERVGHAEAAAGGSSRLASTQKGSRS